MTFDLTRSYCPSRQVLRTFLRMNGVIMSVSKYEQFFGAFRFTPDSHPVRVTLRDNTFKAVHPELDEGPRMNGI